MFIIFTGNGKGKTTAALGQALRAVGDGSKVLMVQFIKGPWKSGEDTSAQLLHPHFLLVKKGRGFVGIGNDTLPFTEHVVAAQEALAYAQKEARTKKWNMLILDEIWNAHQLKLISSQDIQSFIKVVTPCVEHIVCTGRNCPDEFIEKADLVTEMKEIKHPFSHGIPGSKNIEF